MGARASGHAIVMQATSCWMGGLWSDALSETERERTAGIDRRCNSLLNDIDIASKERGRALADHVPAPAPEEAYFPMRAIEPHIVDAIAQEVAKRAANDPGEASEAPHLVTLLRSIADATRETIRARRAADAVKADVVEQPEPATRTADRNAAATKLRASEGIDALFHVDAGRYTDEARAIGLLSALDRMEIARGLPKHLKVYAVGAAFFDVFSVAPPDVGGEAARPIPSGTWLTYLTGVAAAAGHPVPSDARDPQNREPLAWTGILEGFSDRLRASGAGFAAETPIGHIERAVVARLDEEYKGERAMYRAHATTDR